MTDTKLSPPLDTNFVPRSPALMIACWLLTATLLACAIIATLGTNHFEKVFSAFGAELPAMTVFFLKGRYLWWLLPMSALMLAFFVTKEKQHLKGAQTKITIAFIALFLVSLVLVSTAVFAMYLPIFNLGQPIV